MTLPRRRATICGRHEPRQLGQRHDIDLQHGRDLFRLRAIEPAAVAEAGGVDQHVERNAARGKLLRQRGGRSGLAEIGGNNGDGGALGLERFGQGFHRLAAAGDQHEVMAVFRQFARELGADAARRAGHQRDGTRGQRPWHDTFPVRRPMNYRPTKAAARFST